MDAEIKCGPKLILSGQVNHMTSCDSTNHVTDIMIFATCRFALEIAIEFRPSATPILVNFSFIQLNETWRIIDRAVTTSGYLIACLWSALNPWWIAAVSRRPLVQTPKKAQPTVILDLSFSPVEAIHSGLYPWRASHYSAASKVQALTRGCLIIMNAPDRWVLPSGAFFFSLGTSIYLFLDWSFLFLFLLLGLPWWPICCEAFGLYCAVWTAGWHLICLEKFRSRDLWWFQFVMSSVFCFLPSPLPLSSHVHPRAPSTFRIHPLPLCS